MAGDERANPLALVVDDDPTFRALSRLALEQFDLRVEEAGNGRSGVELAQQLQPDIVILDLQMPEMDGFAACTALRRLPGGERLPILIMTGLDDVEAIAHAYEVGATDFITKPCNGLVLGQRVRYMLRASNMFEALLRSETRLTQAQRIAHLGGWEWDLSADRFEISGETSRILGVAERDFGGTRRDYLAFVHPEDRERVAAVIDDAVCDRVGFDLDHRIVRPDGSERIVHAQGEVLCDQQGSAVRMVGTLQDATEQRQAETKIYFLANYDGLTHLPNRQLFQHRVAEALLMAKEKSTIGAVLLVNLDRFQRVNDTFGHRVGDGLLQKIAERFCLGIRTDDGVAQFVSADNALVARFGNDQFALLLTNLSTVQDPAKVAQRLLALLGDPYEIDDQHLVVTASIGISLLVSDGEDVDTLLRNADAAMHAAKEGGRNTYQFYRASMNRALADRMALEDQLRRALERNEFFLYYQPVAGVLLRDIVGVEALIRWRHPKRGLIPPVEFIPVAEQEELIVAIGEWVLRTACAQQRAWRESGLPPMKVSINVSSLQFRQADLARKITTIIYETKADPKFLELELTETMLMNDSQHTAVMLRQLKELGVRLALDDFGTGYSSLAYLRKFPIDTLKIDIAFIRDIKPGSEEATITGAIIALGRALKLRVIAEGVETEAQLAFLRGRGCDEFQGYLFSRPVPAHEVPDLIRSSPPLSLAKGA
jgi:diguanylate cyclase (GGDEF)-like protein/PAS domain S-box-containing protein